MRVLIADDERHAREGMSAFLRTYPGIEVVGEVRDGQSAIELAEAVKPDVLLLDIHMATIDGIEVTRVMKARLPETKVIVLTMESASRGAALAAGADEFLSKGTSPASLVASVLLRHGQQSSSPAVPLDFSTADQLTPDAAAVEKQSV